MGLVLCFQFWLYRKADASSAYMIKIILKQIYGPFDPFTQTSEPTIQTFRDRFTALDDNAAQVEAVRRIAEFMNKQPKPEEGPVV